MKKIILLFGALVSMSAMAQDAETLKVATLEDVFWDQIVTFQNLQKTLTKSSVFKVATSGLI